MSIRILNIYFILICCLCIFSGNAFSDGFIVIPDMPHNASINGAFPLAVKYHHVNVDISDMTAVTYIDQEFYNSTGVQLEGEYIFPIPSGAAIKDFSMYINGKEMEAELLDAEKANAI